jgi:hypothetical protein
MWKCLGHTSTKAPVVMTVSFAKTILAEAAVLAHYFAVTTWRTLSVSPSEKLNVAKS